MEARVAYLELQNTALLARVSKLEATLPNPHTTTDAIEKDRFEKHRAESAQHKISTITTRMVEGPRVEMFASVNPKFKEAVPPKKVQHSSGLLEFVLRDPAPPERSVNGHSIKLVGKRKKNLT
jgi:hypothetical protein